MSGRGAYISGLRKVADLLEQHDELPLPSAGDIFPMTFTFLSGGDRKAALAAAARLIPSQLHKKVRDGDYGSYFDLEGRLDGLMIQLTAFRDDVCERVVTGTREVTKQVPDPAVDVPLVEVTETVEEVEWVCGPLLAGGPR